MHSAAVSDLASLVEFIKYHPLIDNHAHPLLEQANKSTHPLINIISEAYGPASEDSQHTLAAQRALSLLSTTLSCPGVDWTTVQGLLSGEWPVWTKFCYSGVQCVLVDDGLGKGVTQPYTKFDEFTLDPSRRIVRIESVVEEVFHKQMMTSGWIKSWDNWRKILDFRLYEEARRPEVVGFKTIACYRGGLEIPAKPPAWDEVSVALDQWKNAEEGSEDAPRLTDRLLVHWVLHMACEVLKGTGKPLQVHTGLGDGDIELRTASPSHLEPFIIAHPNITFVLLHASYPYTREAGYLTSVHKNVYLDFGLVFPLLSKAGQKAVVKQMLELAPTNKLLWSSDGAYHPERTLLAVRQTREIFIDVLSKRVRSEDMTARHAAEIVQRLFFGNANRIYELELTPKWRVPEDRRLGGGSSITPNQQAHFDWEMALRKSRMHQDGFDGQNDGNASELPIHEERFGDRNSSAEASNDEVDFCTMSSTKTDTETTSPPSRICRKEETLSVVLDSDSDVCTPVPPFTTIFRGIEGVPFLRLQWVDYVNVTRMRVLPMETVKKMFAKNGNCDIRVPAPGLGLLHDGGLSSDSTPTGMYAAIPDWDSLYKMADTGHATVMLQFRHDDGRPLEICPRSVLKMAIKEAAKINIELLVGFETEVCFIPRVDGRLNLAVPHGYHSWSGSTSLTHKMTAMLDEMTLALIDSGIEVLMYHPESGERQFEIVTGALPALAAVDALYNTRLIIEAIADKYSFRATLHPKTYTNQVGTASHTHFSLAKGAEHQDAFVAGLLSQLKVVAAFGMASMASYDRLRAESAWNGGHYSCWGVENREAPLRKVRSGGKEHWEMRCVDGTANIYLLLAAMIAAGLDGIRGKMQLPGPGLSNSAALLTKEERKEAGVGEKLALELEEAIEVLENASWSSENAWMAIPTRKHCVMKRGELEFVKALGEERWEWEAERY